LGRGAGSVGAGPLREAAMSERFFLDAPPQAGRAVLTGDEARHLARVLRARVGDSVRVFDGSGPEWPARVVAIGRDEVTLDVGPPVPPPPAGGLRLTLGVALPKGERQKWLVEKLTELGVHALVPLITARGVAEATPQARDRLRRGVVEACKQCGRTTLLEVGEPRSPAALVASLPAGGMAIVADPGGPPLDVAAVRAAGVVAAVVGPEGGFSAEELAALDRAGATRAGLGPHVLRVETAAIALAARLA
jgi:16S rRNA (uracil1498-N3)-methyltransferase